MLIRVLVSNGYVIVLLFYFEKRDIVIFKIIIIT